jgi:glutaminyl-peptide cyclotransferase
MQRHLSRAAASLTSVFLGIACQATVGCDGTATAPLAPKFEADRAWQHLSKQVECGPRPAGSEALERCRAYLESELKSYGLVPKRETFQESTPGGTIEFTNVYADFTGADPAADMIVVGSHYDTKRMTFPFVGANDGGSSTAVLLEIARVVAASGKRAFSYRFVFFDGEEAVRPDWIDPDNTYGSRHHALELKRAGVVSKVRAFVLLDMVGDKELRLTRDSYSDKRMYDAFERAARENGLGVHFEGKAMDLRDDHDSFMAVGVPSIDLIDFEYGPRNAWWHTADDTLDKCSKESLGAIGKITLLGLVELEGMLGKK